MRHPMSESLSIGSVIRGIHGEDLRGEKTSLECLIGDRRGALLVFWSAACSHCLRYDPYFRRFPHRFPEVPILLVACRSQETKEKLRRELAKRSLDLPLWHDAGAALASRLGIQQTPTALLVGAAGQLLYRGAIDNFRYPKDPAYVPYLDPALAAFEQGRPIERAQTPIFGCPLSSPYYDA